MPEVTSSDDTTIAFDRAGEGPAVILVGGALSTGQRRAGSPHSSPAASVITYDRRGRDDGGDGAPYAVAREIDDLDGDGPHARHILRRPSSSGPPGDD